MGRKNESSTQYFAGSARHCSGQFESRNLAVRSLSCGKLVVFLDQWLAQQHPNPHRFVHRGQSRVAIWWHRRRPVLNAGPGDLWSTPGYSRCCYRRSRGKVNLKRLEYTRFNVTAFGCARWSVFTSLTSSSADSPLPHDPCP